MKDVVVVIPGIGGSVLQRDGKDMWSLSAGAALKTVLTLGKAIKRLELDGDDPDVDDLGDGIRATRLIDDFHVVPGLGWKIDGYTKTTDSLRQRFDLTTGKNFFEFAYDWRRDNRVAARSLARRSHEWLTRWRAASGNDDAKLILVGHSMGGIVARLFLELLDGWKYTRALITFGTPYSGSLNAIDFLANGFKKGWGPFSVDLGDMIGSFTSVYQLLPSYRCLETGAGVWESLDAVDWSGTKVDDDRLRAAIALQRDLRAAVDARRATGAPGYDLRPIVGDFQRSGWSARRVGDAVEIGAMRAVGERDGDGTVPKVSAVPHELLDGFTNVMFAAQKHGSLQNDDAVLAHVASVLRSVDIGAVPVFPAGDEAIALEVDDTTTDAPLVVRARPASPRAEVVARVRPTGGAPAAAVRAGDARTVTMHEVDGGWYEASIDALPACDYRVTVTAPLSTSVTDVASIVDLAQLAKADA